MTIGWHFLSKNGASPRMYMYMTHVCISTYIYYNITNAKYFALQCYSQNCREIFHSSKLFYCVWWNYNVYIMPSLGCKCTEMRNILLCNVIVKTAVKYFTQANYFTVYDETTMSTLCPFYIVNVQKWLCHKNMCWCNTLYI